MSSFYQKYIRVMLAIVLVIGGLAGCSKGATLTGGADNSGSGGRAATNVTTPLKLQFLVPTYADVPNMSDEYWTEWQKRTNTQLNVEWVPSGDYDTKLALVLASGNLPEILVSTSTTQPTLLKAIKQGDFWDLTPFLGDFSKYPNMKKNAGPNVWNYVKLDGKIYGIPRNRPQIDLGIKMRKDWLDKLKLPVPTTLDEYEADLKKIVDGDPDGNGKKDTIGLIGQGFLVADGDDTFEAAFGNLDPTYDSNGGLMHHYLTPKYTEMVSWFRKLYADGVLAKEFTAIKKTQAEGMFATGRAASYVRNIWRDYSWEQDNKKTQPDAKIITLPPLKGPNGVAVSLANPTFGAFYISKKVPEAKVRQILDYFEKTTTPEFTQFNYYGIVGVHNKVVDGQPQLTDLGVKQVTTSANQVFPLAFNNKMKVINPSAPKSYNDAKMKEVEVFSQVGKMNPFQIISSDTWTNLWPKYEKEWQTMVIKAIVGQISMDEYKSYVDKLNANPDFRKAYKEFADSYKQYFSK